MNYCIKVVNPDVANKLAASGFSYIEEQIGGKSVFAFANSKDLQNMLSKQFACSDYFIENKLRF